MERVKICELTGEKRSTWSARVGELKVWHLTGRVKCVTKPFPGANRSEPLGKSWQQSKYPLGLGGVVQ